MVYYYSSITLCKSVDQPIVMPGYVNSADPSAKSRHSSHVSRNGKMPNSPNCLKIPACDRSRSAALDIVIMIAVVAACGFLLFPYVKFVIHEFTEITEAILYMVREEVSHAPLIYASIGLSSLCASLAAWGVLACTSRRCGKPNCKGLRKAAEFDIQLETEETVRNSTPLIRDGVNKGLFELPLVHHRELEAELKKMAPFNGRAVLIFRARCGCSVGRLEVPGQKKHRKLKK